jgi:hypothetical protein
MVLDYHDNNSESNYNKKISKNGIEDTINHIYNNYLTIILDINGYSQKLHDNIYKIYPIYLFSKILKMAQFDNSNSINKIL